MREKKVRFSNCEKTKKRVCVFLINYDTKCHLPMFILIKPIYMSGIGSCVNAGERYYAHDNTKDKVFPRVERPC